MTTRRDFIELASSFLGAATLASCTHAPITKLPTHAERTSTMRTRPLMTLKLATAPTQELGAGPRGTRLTFPITGGTFEGERLRGKV
ncbi:MAG TPA: DUF3237 family protein, partial [Polyangiaceae bacterium]|nr:DUF3237 family protein [Polyangiaceae bacterium]